MTTRGWVRRPRCTRPMNWRSISSVTSRSAITPWRSGPAGRDCGRRATDHPLGVVTNRQHAAGLGVLGHDGGLGHHYSPAADVHQRVRGTEVDGEVASPAEAQASSPGHLANKR